MPENYLFFFHFKVTVLFGKGAFRLETLPVGGAGLLDRTVAELTDAPDRRGEKGRKAQHSTKSTPVLTTWNKQACISKCVGKVVCSLTLTCVVLTNRMSSE